MAGGEEGCQLARLPGGHIGPQVARVVQTGRPTSPATCDYFQQHPGGAAWFARDVPPDDSPPWHVAGLRRQ